MIVGICACVCLHVCNLVCRTSAEWRVERDCAYFFASLAFVGPENQPAARNAPGNEDNLLLLAAAAATAARLR